MPAKGAATLERFGRFQVGSVLATTTDWLVMIGCVELLRASPVLATGLGTVAGGVVGFTVGRRWVFRATGSVSRQALLYLAVWAVSSVLNTLGEHLLVGALGNYLVARLIVATMVGVGWNWEMSRRVVFREAMR